MQRKIQKQHNLPKRFIKFWVPVILWALVIFLFSAKPTHPVSQIYIKDFAVKKSAHIFEYAVFTILLYRALKASGVEGKEAALYSFILAVLYGVSDEFHQYFTPGREPKIRDIFFDTIGAIFAIYFIWKLLPKAPARLKILARNLQLL